MYSKYIKEFMSEIQKQLQSHEKIILKNEMWKRKGKELSQESVLYVFDIFNIIVKYFS